MRLLAYGTDASFYRLIPQVVVKVESEDEAASVLAACRRDGLPVTFRAAGTSLSGQAVSDSVLMMLGDKWDRVEVQKAGALIRLQPGVLGADANGGWQAMRARSARTRLPSTAPRSAASPPTTFGHVLRHVGQQLQDAVSMRLLLADGTLVDTGDAESVAGFRTSHGDLLARLDELGRATRADAVLAKRIRDKFAIKNTTGYSINALVDFEDLLRSFST